MSSCSYVGARKGEGEGGGREGEWTEGVRTKCEKRREGLTRRSPVENHEHFRLCEVVFCQTLHECGIGWRSVGGVCAGEAGGRGG